MNICYYYFSSEQPSSWNSQGQTQSRTISVSSAGAEGSSDNGWSSGSGPTTRSSPPNSINQQPTNLSAAGEPSWPSQNGGADPRKLNRWDSTPAQQPMRMNSMSGDTGKGLSLVEHQVVCFTCHSFRRLYVEGCHHLMV